MPVSNGSRRNALKFKDRVALADLVRKDWEEIEDKQPTFDAYAREAQEKLGFAVTYANVAGVCEDLGLEWPSRLSIAKRNSNAKLELAEDLAVIAVACVHVISHMGGAKEFDLPMATYEKLAAIAARH